MHVTPSLKRPANSQGKAKRLQLWKGLPSSLAVGIAGLLQTITCRSQGQSSARMIVSLVVSPSTAAAARGVPVPRPR